jgi:hypothetical protein
MIDRETAIECVKQMAAFWDDRATADLGFHASEIIAALSPQWQGIATAPKDGKVYGGRWDGQEWAQAVVKSPPSAPFTHWTILMPAPAR